MEGGILVWENKNLIKIFTCVYVNKKVCAPFFDLVHPSMHHQVGDNLQKFLLNFIIFFIFKVLFSLVYAIVPSFP